MNQWIKLIIVAVLLAAAVFLIRGKQEKTEKKNERSDYETIEQVQGAVVNAINAGALNIYENQVQWYIFDLRIMYRDDNTFTRLLKKNLGEDFNTKLSTGDYLFVGVLPYRKSYRIYAGDPADENNMIYPEWKYNKLKKQQSQ